ncbi:alpha/beta hydrolase [Luteimonas sp. TWI1416]|uniref:alpha/beta hydrolase n=1 Tax=unclassified Luteimonas TaxID=2629088 RepID=UPI003207EC69
MDARQSADWWHGLAPQEQQAYQTYQSASLGALDGLPAEVRHAANLDVLRADAINGTDRQNAQALLDRIEGSWHDPDAADIYLLGYTPPGAGNSPDARVVASLGNPDTADNVGIYVPGTGSDLSNIGGSLDRVDDLRAEADMVPGAGENATIVWLGYDAPDTVWSARRDDFAADGAQDLRSFTEGLRTSSQSPGARVTIIGHSYGSTVIGHADALGTGGLAVDDVVVMGSPGLGVGSVEDLHVDDAHFWSGMANNDEIRFTPRWIHGPNPVNAGYGGQRIDTGDASGHSQYWNPGGESLRNQAYIMTGNPGMVSTVAPR